MTVKRPQLQFVCHSYYVALPRGRIKCCTTSVCPSVPCLRFSRNMKTVETYNLVETQRWTILTNGANLSSIGQGHWKRNRKNRFSRISWSKVDRFTSKMTIAQFYTSSNTFHQRKCFVFVIKCVNIWENCMSQQPRTCVSISVIVGASGRFHTVSNNLYISLVFR